MEMKNDIAIRNKTAALAKAKSELAAFKNKNVSPEHPPWKELLTHVNARESSRLEQNTAYKDLWCSKHPGMISQAKFELTGDKAKAYEAVKINSRVRSSNASRQHRQSDTDFMNKKLAFHHKWDGCPHCRSYGFIFCNNCKTLSCWDNPKDDWHECPNCENGARVGKSGITLKIEKDNPPHALTGQKQNKALPKPKGKGLMLPPRR